jgi:hypothetical protein
VKAKRAKAGATSVPDFTEELAADLYGVVALSHAHLEEYKEAVIELLEVGPLMSRSRSPFKSRAVCLSHVLSREYTYIQKQCLTGKNCLGSRKGANVTMHIAYG